MNKLNFSPDQMLTLTLAADARLSSTDYVDDQVWEFKYGGTEPSSISVETTFGLRARLCRIFPRFIFDGKVFNDPAQFSPPIMIHRYFPNFLEFSFKPFTNINVILEYWVPASQIIAGRITITNISHEKCAMQLELAELLLPSLDGSRMTLNEIGMASILFGKTSNISPVLFLTGGAQAGKSPYPSLQLSLTLSPHERHEACWVHASHTDVEKSYDLVKEVINKNWDAEFARITRVNSVGVEIQTGNKDWDTAFYLSQVLAYQLFLRPNKYCKAPSILTTRKPDQGYSLLGDGSDYNDLWYGQTPFDVNFLAYILLPASPDLVKGLLDNFLDIQTPDGEIDLKPGLSAKRSRLLATPLLADTALQLSQYFHEDYFKLIFSKLVSFFQAWFSSSHDRDGDYFPEWDHPFQTGFDELPVFSQYHLWPYGIDISSVEHPGLCSYLYREGISLIKIGEKLNDKNSIKMLEACVDKLKTSVEQSWSDQYASYLPRDRDSHNSSKGDNLGTRAGEGSIEIHKDFPVPIRPFIIIESKQEVTHPSKIFIHGTGETGAHRVEHIPASRIYWQRQFGYTTSTYNYNLLERIEIRGIRPDDVVTVKTANLTFLDQTLLLPLWAGIPSKERAKILINLTIMNKKKFFSPYGLRSWIEFSGMDDIPGEYYGINIPWIAFTLDGLIQYGERAKAAEIFQRLMKPVVRSINTNSMLNQSYHSENGKPLGAHNTLSSLIPIGLFLKILGIKIVNSLCIENSGNNPFPWPVTIKFQGMTIIKQEKKTKVIFPDGKNLSLENDQRQRIIYNRISQEIYKNNKIQDNLF